MRHWRFFFFLPGLHKPTNDFRTIYFLGAAASSGWEKNTATATTSATLARGNRTSAYSQKELLELLYTNRLGDGDNKNLCLETD